MQHSLMGYHSKWTCFTRTMPGIGPYLLALEEIIRTTLIPALTYRPPPNNTECDLLALPARLGAIALANPTQATDTEFLFSTKITETLKEAILQQDFQYTSKVVAHQLQAKQMRWDYPYSSTMSWFCCRLTFSLLHSAIQCIRSARFSCSLTTSH